MKEEILLALNISDEIVRKADLTRDQIETQRQLLSFSSIRQLSHQDMFDMVRTQILKAYLTAGQTNYTNAAVEVMTTDLILKLKNEYSNLTVQSVCYAIGKGAYGDYLKEGEVLFISLANMIKWVRKYKDDERQKAMLAINMANADANKPKPPTPEEIENIMREAFKYALAHVRSGKTYHDAGNALYSCLVRTGNIDPFLYREYVNEIEDSINQTPQSLEQKAELESLWYDITTGNSDAIKVRAKNRAINVYLSNYGRKEESKANRAPAEDYQRSTG